MAQAVDEKWLSIAAHGFTAADFESIELRRVSTLRPYEARWVHVPRFDDAKDQWESFVKNIQTSGVVDPLWILDDGRVFDGRHRLAAAQKVGLVEVPVQVLRVSLPLSETDQRRVEQCMAGAALLRRQMHSAAHADRAMMATPYLADGLRVVESRQFATGGVHKTPDRSAPKTSKQIAHDAGKTSRSAHGKGHRQAERARRVARDAPDLVDKVARGELTLRRADDQIRERNGTAPRRESQVEKETREALRAFIEKVTDCIRSSRRWPRSGQKALLETLAHLRRDMNDLVERLAERAKREAEVSGNGK